MLTVTARPVLAPGPLTAVHVLHHGDTLCGARPVDSWHLRDRALWERLVPSLQCRDCLEWLHA